MRAAEGGGPGADRRWAVNGRFLCEPFSGVQRAGTGFLRWLAQRGDDILLVVPAGHRPDWWTGRVRVAPVPPGRPGRLLWEQLAPPALARGRRVLSLANTAPMLRRDLVTVYDLAFLAHPDWFRRSFRLAYGTVTARAALGSPRVIVPSAFTADELKRLLGVPRRRITVVPPGIDERFRPPGPGECARARERYDLPDSFVLVVATIDPRKGLDTAARAAEGAGVPLVVAGGRASSFSSAAVPGSVRWLGRVPDADLPALYAGAGAVLYPSRYEGFGLPPLEAMACGAPVLAADLPALRETLSGAAVLLDPADVGAWTVALRDLLGSAEQGHELRECGRERAARYTWARAGDGLGAVMAAWPGEP